MAITKTRAKLTLLYLHAEHRCAPCRDMSDRIKAVQSRRPDLENDPVRVIDVDHEPDLAAAYKVKVVPTIILVNDVQQELYRSDGRITSAEFEQLWQMAQDRKWDPAQFRPEAPSADLVFYRTYSRRNDLGDRETWAEVVRRSCDAMGELGRLNPDDRKLVERFMADQRVMPSGRWMWVGGTPWVQQPENYSGAYNCTSTVVEDPAAFGLLMDLAMMGSGTGAVLEDWAVAKLPKVYNSIVITDVLPVGKGAGGNPETTAELSIDPENEQDVVLQVGDSRKGWVDAYQALIDWMFSADLRKKLNKVKAKELRVQVDLSQVRGPGEPLKGFGGTANPAQLPALFSKVANISNKAKGRNLSAVECCLLIDAAAACVVAGNIRRSAGMRQFSATNEEAAQAKTNLYVQDGEGNWRVDPEREDLRMANHTRVFHTQPTLEEITEAVRLQFHTGEGAIQYAPESIARGSVDLLGSEDDREALIDCLEEGVGREFLCSLIDVERPDMAKEEKDWELDHRMSRYGLNPCGEIIGRDFHCNLAEVHLNTLNPKDLEEQEDAFRAAAVQVCALLHHQFVEERYHLSRVADPIVGVSFTGLYDFFAHAFGIEWLQWMQEGRPEQDPMAEQWRESEKGYLSIWRNTVRHEVIRYCEEHRLKAPNRATTVQPAGTKSLLTGASSGWHPPKAQRFIRRITTGREDPVALAAMELGYRVIPAQSARDEEGNLLDNIYDPRVGEWLVEVPTQVSWAEIKGAEEIDLDQLPVRSQYKLWMQVQQHYTEHNTSATLELREHEIEELGELIHDSIKNREGYISAALLARFDATGGTFPRLPFEPISKARYEKEMREVEERRQSEDFAAALSRVDDDRLLTPQESACTSAACIAKADKVESLSAGTPAKGS